MHHTFYRSIAACVVAVALAKGEDEPGSDTTTFRSSVEKCDLVERVAAPWNKVHQWFIEYEAVASFSRNGSVPVHKIVAVSAPDKLYHMAAHFPESRPWQLDPYCQELIVCDGRSFHNWPFNRAYTEGILKVGDPLPGSVWADVLLAMIPRWPLTKYTLPVDPATSRRIVPVDALLSEEYRLLLSSEPVAGEECAIFDDGGTDRIWVATNKGLCVMRREVRDRHSGSLLQRIVTEELAEVAEGLWLPTLFRSQLFSGTGRTNLVVTLDSHVRILRCELNESVPQSVFAPQQVPGALQYDRTNGFRQVVAGGEDLLEAMVDFMVEYGGLPTQPVLKRHSYVLFGLGVVSGLCGGFVVFSIIGKQSAKAKIR